MAPDHDSPGRPSARVITAVILALIAVALACVGIIYLAEPSRSLPSVLPGHLAAAQPAAGTNHPLRAAGCFVLGAIFVASAWFALSFQPKAPAAGAAQPASPAARR